MSDLVRIITSADPAVRDRSLDAFSRAAGASALLGDCAGLDSFRRSSDNLYERVRAQFFLYAIHRFHLPYKEGVSTGGLIPFDATLNILKRRYEEAIDILLAEQTAHGPGAPLSSALA